MKKRVVALALGLVLAFGVTACGKKADDTTASSEASSEQTISVQQEIIKFVGTDLPGIAADRDKAVELYNEYFKAGEGVESEKWMDTLSKEALPKYDTYLAKLKAITTSNKEVEELKQLYLESSQLQRDAIQDVVNAIKNADSKLLDSAQSKVDDSQKKMKVYNEKLDTLCKANNITLEKPKTKTTEEGASEAATGASTEAATEATTEAAEETTEAEQGGEAGE